jgi:hypothetical protein
MGVNVRFTTKTSESCITVQNKQKWHSYKKMQIVASFQQDLKFLNRIKIGKVVIFYLVIIFYAFSDW